ncbi:redoxin family protein [Campylobacter sp. faydin G-24]|uniref:Redoxin family protein n=1 Tax=Campylobacter anatolicus TaxID=2829105 RepID=A0ABS5HI70_9BACT|nr:redoxin family protein [Campylobacter anatolicus]MBR8463287.1 redoxin family protein [Campylobacter anatolicus]
MIKIPTNITLKGLDGAEFDLSKFAMTHNFVMFLYPKLGESGKGLSDELKNMCAMTGCTAQANEYKKLLSEFNTLGFKLVAVGTQDVFIQQSFKESIGAEFIYLNDDEFMLERALKLPTFKSADDKKFYFRQTLVVKNGEIIHKNLISNPELDAENTLKLIREFKI